MYITQHQNRVLPKFGDWDATGLQFTAIFDQACNEKKSTSGFQGSPSKKVTPTVEDEDLYKPKIAPRRQSVSKSWNLLLWVNRINIPHLFVFFQINLTTYLCRGFGLCFAAAIMVSEESSSFFSM
jgi:hypothetical protein